MNTPVPARGNDRAADTPADTLSALSPDEQESRFPRRFLLGAGAVAAAGVAQVASASGAQAAPPSTTWKLGGNADVSTDGSNYIGTNNVAPLIFKTKTGAGAAVKEAMRISSSGRLGVGVTTPQAKLDVLAGIPAAFRAESTSDSGTAVTAVAPFCGVNGTADSYGGIFQGSYGVFADGASYGLYALGDSYGSFSSGGSYGAYGSSNGTGVRGVGGTYGLTGSGTSRGLDATSAAIAIYGRSSGYVGIAGDGPTWGVVGQTTASTGTSYGVFGEARTATGGTAYAGGFAGNVAVFGTLSKSAGSFRIDHPLDPDERWLSHSFVESPDMMNVYNGTVTLGAKGRATVELPDYFEALNRDFRYQLTAIGSPAPDLHVAAEVTGNAFRIAGGRAGQRVSWQVTGVRQDAYAKAHPIVVETAKAEQDRGRYAFVPAGAKGARSVAERFVPGPDPVEDEPPAAPR